MNFSLKRLGVAASKLKEKIVHKAFYIGIMFELG